MKNHIVCLIAAFLFLNATSHELSFLAEIPPIGWKTWDLVVMDTAKDHLKANSDAVADKTVKINIDFNSPIGKIRRLHGTNLGPPINNAATQDVVAKDIKEFNLPIIRLHDAPLENRGMHVVDISQIFPLFHADPQDPDNYYFAQTDDYIANCFDTGAKVSYRLGESIEHSRKKYFVHPPEDYSKWADICINIIRHYNEGWANGFHYNMDYWHIWEEPDNFPRLWTGSWEDYIKLYVNTAREIRHRFPDLKVGGPAMMDAVGRLSGISPTLVDTFLKECRRQEAPLDFFSWNCYSDDPDIILKESESLRKKLDTNGFLKTELHVAEWHYWTEPNTYETRNDINGAAYLTAFLTCLQDTPVDKAFYYTGSTTSYGFYDTSSKEKNKCFFGMKAFSIMVNYENRLSVQKIGNEKDIWVLAGQKENGDAAILFSCINGPAFNIKIGLENCNMETKKINVSILNAGLNLEPLDIIPISGSEIPLSKTEGSTVFLIEL